MLAVFASTQEAAATEAVRQQLDAERPVRGSTMWWSAPAAVAQRRTVVPDVARPPAETLTVGPGESSGSRVVVGDANRPAGEWWLAGDRDVSTQEDEDAAARRGESRARGSIGGKRFGRRAEVVHARRNANRSPLLVGSIVCQSGPRANDGCNVPSRPRTTSNVRS